VLLAPVAIEAHRQVALEERAERRDADRVGLDPDHALRLERAQALQVDRELPRELDAVPGLHRRDVDDEVAHQLVDHVAPQLVVGLGPRLRGNDLNVEDDERALEFVVNSTARGVESHPLRDVETTTTVNGPLTWVAIKSKYFLAAVLQSDDGALPFGGVIARPTGQPLSANLDVTVLPDPDGVLAYRAYVGPQKPDHLAAVGHGLQDVAVFGWKFG